MSGNLFMAGVLEGVAFLIIFSTMFAPQCATQSMVQTLFPLIEVGLLTLGAAFFLFRDDTGKTSEEWQNTHRFLTRVGRRPKGRARACGNRDSCCNTRLPPAQDDGPEPEEDNQR